MVETNNASRTGADGSKGLVIAREAGVVTVQIDAPDEGNRLSPDLLMRLEKLALDLVSDDETHAVVVIGSGDADFSTGILNPTVRGAMSKDEVIAVVRLANRAFDALDAAPQIVIAALNGAVRAGGAELALACDIRLAAAHATLDFPEAAWGGFPGAGGPYRLSSVVGRGRALELICSGRKIDAIEMERLGLVQGVYEKQALRLAATTLAHRVSAAGPLATRGAKRIIRARLGPGLEFARELSDALRHELEWSSDVDEAIAAHQEGRVPHFRGR